MPTSGLGSTAETNRLLGGNYFNTQTGAQIKPFTPSSNTSTTISTDVIGTQPFKLPPVSNTTIASGLTGMVTGVFESEKLLQQQQDKAKEASIQVEEDKSGIIDTMKNILGLQAGRAQAEEDAGISQMSQDVNRANQAYLSSQRAEVNELRALESQVGLSPEGKQQAQAAISRKYAFENADNALTLSLARQDLATAESILNKKYELQMEPLKTVLDIQKFFYQENKDDMTKAEDREFQTLLAQNERDYNLKLADYNSIGELALLAGQNGAPPSLVAQISNAPTKAEALRLASSYATDPLERENKRLANEKLRADIAKIEAETNMPVGEDSAYLSERKGRIISSVDELLAKTSGQTVGILSLARFAPGSIQRNYAADLDTLKANIAFSELQAMREASKTGGALGNVANQELALLEATLGALDQGQSPTNMKKNLNKVKESLDRWHAVADGASDEAKLKALGYTAEQIKQIKNAK